MPSNYPRTRYIRLVPRGTSWWIAGAERSVSDVVPAPPDEVRAFYVDLDNIKLVHPLVVSVQSIARTQTTDGYTETYRVRDRIPFGPVALSIVYTTRLKVPVLGDVLTEARQFPRVALDGVVSFVAEGDGTRVTERLAIRAPRPLAGTTVRQAVAAHVEMLAGIRRHFA
jgi:ligand-binding SRPBCC domain-containing protein